MKEVPENGKESSHSACANGMNECDAMKPKPPCAHLLLSSRAHW